MPARLSNIKAEKTRETGEEIRRCYSGGLGMGTEWKG